jgi:anti-sigma factor RsiW
VSCQEFVELVTDYFEGTLSDEDTARFESHIDDCPFCTLYLEQMRTTIVTVGHIETDSISPEARDTLLGAFRDWHAGAQPLP